MQDDTPKVDLGFPQIAELLRTLKDTYDKGDIDLDLMEERKAELLGEAAKHESPESPRSPTAESAQAGSLSPEKGSEPPDAKDDKETVEGFVENGKTNGNADADGKDKKGSKGKGKNGRKGKGKKVKTNDFDADAGTGVGAETAIVLVDECVHSVSRFFESSPKFAGWVAAEDFKIPHRFEVGDHCLLNVVQDAATLDGCLAEDEVGEIMFDLFGYTDDTLVLQVLGPRGDTWWYSTSELVDGNAEFERRENERMEAEAAEAARIAAEEAAALQAILDEEEEEARRLHEEEQARIAAEIFAEESEEEEEEEDDAIERGPRTKKQIAGQVAWAGTKLGAKATYKTSKVATKVAVKTTKVTAKTTLKVAKDDRSHTVAKGVLTATAVTTKHTVKGSVSILKVATPALINVSTAGTKFALRGTAAAATAAASRATSAMGAMTSSVQASTDGEEFSQELEDALAELEESRFDEVVQEGIYSEIAQLQWLVDEEMIVDHEMHNQVAIIEAAVEANKAKRVAAKQAAIEAAKRIDPRVELGDWMSGAVKLGRHRGHPPPLDVHTQTAAVLYEHGITSLGELRFRIHSGAIGIIDLLDYGIDTQHHSTAIWTAMMNSIDKEKTYSAMYIQRLYRYKMWRAAVHDARLQSLQTGTASAAYELGNRHLQRHRWLDAVASFESALELDPSNKDILAAIEKAQQGLRLKEFKKTEGRKAAKEKLKEMEQEWEGLEEEKRLQLALEKAAKEATQREAMIARQGKADELFEAIESGEWDEQKRHKELLLKNAAEELERKRAQDIKDQIASEKAAKVNGISAQHLTLSSGHIC
eukprot:SAG11_NODE_953_length_6401_cov_6.463980_3_plen_819_part_00